MKVVIVSGGNPPPEKILLEQLEEADLIIGVDKGCDVLIEHEIIPHYILGDFDSATKDITILINKGAEKIVFPAEKDETDSALAVNLSIEKGATKIVGLGMTGTRYDHTLANFGLLKKALEKNIGMQIIDGNNTIFLTKKPMKLYGKKGDTISFQAYDEKVKNLSISHAKYLLEDYDLNIGDSRTVSNEFVESYMDIKFDKGTLMVIYAKD
jgi:thiamine pyrophosphokinase